MLPSPTPTPRAAHGGTLRQWHEDNGLGGSGSLGGGGVQHKPGGGAPASPASEGMGAVSAGAGAAAAAFGSAQLVKIELLQERFPHVNLDPERRHFSAILRAASAANGSPSSSPSSSSEEGRVDHQQAA